MVGERTLLVLAATAFELLKNCTDPINNQDAGLCVVSLKVR